MAWPVLLLYGAAAAIGTLLFLTDLRDQRVPDRLTLPSYPLLVGLMTLAAAVTDSWSSLGRALLAGALLFVVYVAMVIVLPGGFYFGDAKLGGLVGLVLGWTGWGAVALGVAASWVLLAATGVLLMAVGRATRKTELPFGPFMIIGAILGIVFGARLLPVLG